jgi:hypothetical protein
MKLCISALGPTITEQAKARGYQSSMPTDRLDRLEHAIHLLRISGLLTDAESDRAFKRLLKDAKFARATGN